jgi:hypothetical protein
LHTQVKRAGSHEFVQLRNPWGKNGEWEGPWSDSSRLWDVNPGMKEKLGVTVANDGTCFISTLLHFNDPVDPRCGP